MINIIHGYWLILVGYLEIFAVLLAVSLLVVWLAVLLQWAENKIKSP